MHTHYIFTTKHFQSGTFFPADPTQTMLTVKRDQLRLMVFALEKRSEPVHPKRNALQSERGWNFPPAPRNPPATTSTTEGCQFVPSLSADKRW